MRGGDEDEREVAQAGFFIAQEMRHTGNNYTMSSIETTSTWIKPTI
jgi:hypothetical protein